MASSTHILLFCLLTRLLSLSSHAVKVTPPHALHLPIRKDPDTEQYYTEIEMGANNTKIPVVLDLATDILWFNCDQYFSSSYRPIPCGSSKCKSYKGEGCRGCNMTARPGCTNNTCGSNVLNPFSSSLYLRGFGEDTMSTHSTDGRFVLTKYDSTRFVFSCADSAALEDLANGTQGMVGLGRTTTSLHTQLSFSLQLPHIFALCLPSSSEFGLGDIFIGGGPYFMPPVTKDFSKSLTTTPLIINPHSTSPVYREGDPSYEYFIGVKSIRVDNETLSFDNSVLSIDKNGNGGTMLSIKTPYTFLQTSIYEALVTAFVKAAKLRKIKRVITLGAFGACFSSRSIARSQGVPTIDLILHREDVKWTLNAANSLVEVREGVTCLAFFDNGDIPRTSIVLAGHQLENHVLEFDLVSSKLGFSSSLLLHNTSCSHARVF